MSDQNDMSAKPTAGPWAVGESYTGEPAILAPQGECVAVACQLLAGEAEANARLLAAAPDMLAALIEVTGYAIDCASQRYEPRPGCIARAHALVARAQGEQQEVP